MFRRGKRSKLENPSVLARACVRAPRMGRIGSRPAQAPIICGEWRVEKMRLRLRLRLWLLKDAQRRSRRLRPLHAVVAPDMPLERGGRGCK